MSLAKLAKAAAIAVAAAFVLLIGLVAWGVVPPVVEASQIIDKAHADGIVTARVGPAAIPRRLSAALMAESTPSRKREGYVASGNAVSLANHLEFRYSPADRAIRSAITRAAIAHQLDWRFEDEALLFAVSRQAYFGRNAYGFQQASAAWFGAPPENLSLSEAAFLAGLLKGPDSFDPARHPKRALDRRNTVLTRMRQLNLTSATEYQAALADPLSVVPSPKTPTP